MELRQESLFADETKGGIEVIYSKFIDQRRMDYKALFGGFDHLRVRWTMEGASHGVPLLLGTDSAHPRVHEKGCVRYM